MKKLANKIKKLLVKWFMPKPKSLANMAARAAADFVNSTGKEEAITTFFEKTQDLFKAQQLITKWLSDGKFDENEVAELEAELMPLMETVYGKVMEKIGG